MGLLQCKNVWSIYPNGNQKVVKGYRWLYILAVVYRTVHDSFCCMDHCGYHFNGLMAIPNLIALVALSGVVVSETKLYLKRIGKAS